MKKILLNLTYIASFGKKTFGALDECIATQASVSSAPLVGEEV